MNILEKNISFFIPDRIPLLDSLKRVTHLGIGAHQDDLEIMTFHGIKKCYQKKGKWYGGIVCTDGSGAPRTKKYAHYSDSDLAIIRSDEQKKAAQMGNYSFVAQMGYKSPQIKKKNNVKFTNNLAKLLSYMTPEVIYTHNPADKHSTHVVVAINTIKILRELPTKNTPQRIYGCECWSDLDWLLDKDKVVFDVSDQEGLGISLLKVFNSQIEGGKRYDLATMGRRISNATFFNSKKEDQSAELWYAIDLTPLIMDKSIDILEYILNYIENFKNSVINNIRDVV